DRCTMRDSETWAPERDQVQASGIPGIQEMGEDESRLKCPGLKFGPARPYALTRGSDHQLDRLVRHVGARRNLHARKNGFEAFAKWSKEDLRANVAFMRAFSKELKEEGVFVATEGLASPDEATIARAGHDGEPVTDGVFPETKEFLAGYWIVDVEGPEQACKVAARASVAPGPGGNLRPPGRRSRLSAPAA